MTEEGAALPSLNGIGVGGAGLSVSRLIAITGPQEYPTYPFRQADYQIDDTSNFATILGGYAIDLCGGTLEVTKLIETDAGFAPAEGWAFQAVTASGAQTFPGAAGTTDADGRVTLPRFYEDMARHALPTQLFFLFQRIGQLRELAQPGLFSGAVVADFLLEKDPLFAQLTLTGDELALYQRIYDSLSPQAPRPDVIIYLHADLDTLHERVRKRALDYEAPITREYLATLADAYSRFFYHYTGAPLLVVNSERLNFVDSNEDLELLVEHLAAMRGEREFFNVGE